MTAESCYKNKTVRYNGMNYRQAWKQCTASGIMKNLIATDVVWLHEISYYFILNINSMESSDVVKNYPETKKINGDKIISLHKKEWIIGTAI